MVAVTAGCSVFREAESLAVGFIGGALAILGESLMVRLHIDDPVCATPVHLLPSFWGVLAVGLFGSSTYNLLEGSVGLIHGGGFKLLGIQMLGASSLLLWSLTTSYLFFKAIQLTIGLRLGEKEEILGADWVEH
ncbi:MAG: hypothetical protein GY696_36215, partial [Gammaproteobacteria bacterium]|nr:hypothetical protein [Gammaproteobacteria bacterium]